MTKQEVIAAILDCNEKLGRVPSRTELNKLTQVSRRQIRRHFPTYARALKECKLQAKGGGRRIDMEFLFRDWAGVARKLEKIPTICEYEETGAYSHRPLITRFGAWMIVPEGMKQFAEEHGLAEEWKDVLEMVDARTGP